MKNKYASIVVDGILSGLFLCVGCMVYMLCENKIAGSFMFSLGLMGIITFKLSLYTGKAGYMAVRPPSYIGEVALTFVSNAMGAGLGGLLLNLTKFGPTLSEKASTIIDGKFADSAVSIFILAVFCGIMMWFAVDGSRAMSEKGNHFGFSFMVVMPIVVFITCGFNHCVADLCYFFISRCHAAAHAPRYFVCAVLGNAAGCMFIPFMKKFSIFKY